MSCDKSKESLKYKYIFSGYLSVYRTTHHLTSTFIPHPVSQTTLSARVTTDGSAATTKTARRPARPSRSTYEIKSLGTSQWLGNSVLTSLRLLLKMGLKKRSFCGNKGEILNLIIVLQEAIQINRFDEWNKKLRYLRHYDWVTCADVTEETWKIGWWMIKLTSWLTGEVIKWYCQEDKVNQEVIMSRKL